MKAFNFVTNTEYSGQNAELEGNGKYPAFASFKQITSMGYSVNKGAKGVKIPVGFHTRTVFDIVDTNAIQDADLIDFIERGEREAAKQPERKIKVVFA